VCDEWTHFISRSLHCCCTIHTFLHQIHHLLHSLRKATPINNCLADYIFDAVHFLACAQTFHLHHSHSHAHSHYLCLWLIDVQLYDRFLSAYFPIEAADITLSDEEKAKCNIPFVIPPFVHSFTH
jgi:hypothetical protein